MTCQAHKDKGSIRPSFTEQMVMNYDRLPGGMKGWRMFRIEYGFECSCPEGIIWLPPNITWDEIDSIERLLRMEAVDDN